MSEFAIILGFLWDLFVVWFPWFVIVAIVWFVVFCATYKRKIG